VEIPLVRHDVAGGLDGNTRRVTVRGGWPSSDVETKRGPSSGGSRLHVATARLALVQDATVVLVSSLLSRNRLVAR